MKLHGYSDEGKPLSEVVPAELAEVTLNATASELRAMAWFLISVANDMERLGSKFNHAHLSDALPQFESSPHFVVFGSSTTSPELDREQARMFGRMVDKLNGGGDDPTRA